VNGGGFLKGLQLSNFLDTVAEWHALTQGFCETFCPWPPRHKLMDEDLAAEIRTEHHYYTGGRALGLVSLVLFSVMVLSFVHRIVS